MIDKLFHIVQNYFLRWYVRYFITEIVVLPICFLIYFSGKEKILDIWFVIVCQHLLWNQCSLLLNGLQFIMSFTLIFYLYFLFIFLLLINMVSMVFIINVYKKWMQFQKSYSYSSFYLPRLIITVFLLLKLWCFMFTL